MVTPVCTLSVAALRYDALLASRTAVSFTSSGNLTNWLLTQLGRSIAAAMSTTPRPASTTPMTRRTVPPKSCFRDHVVGEPAQVVELAGERLGVRAGHVGPAEADDHVGHAQFLQSAHAVHGV